MVFSVCELVVHNGLSILKSITITYMANYIHRIKCNDKIIRVLCIWNIRIMSLSDIGFKILRSNPSYLLLDSAAIAFISRGLMSGYLYVRKCNMFLHLGLGEQILSYIHIRLLANIFSGKKWGVAQCSTRKCPFAMHWIKQFNVSAQTRLYYPS